MFRVARALARLVRAASRRVGRTGGTTAPGRMLLMLSPRALRRMSAELDAGSALVSATNGKTTTAAMIAAALERAGRPVVHNRAGSNMAWGVEKIIESASERPLNRFEQQKYPTAPPAGPADTLNYLLATTVPDYWIPLLPVQSEAGLRLQRGKVLQVDGQLKTVGAKGRVLNADRPLAIFEEEIPREGIRVTRTWQLARWHDGSTHLWIGRQKEVGRGEGSSGLRFDSV